MPSSYQAIIDSPLGHLGILLSENELFSIDFLNPDASEKKPTTPAAVDIVDELNCYFNSAKNKFTVPLNLRGTPFQKRVWQALTEIPVGNTLTYGELAKQLKTSPRAIGNACRSNPIPIIVPCHRIVGQNNLGGYNGHTAGTPFARKKWLLLHESKK